MLKEVTKVWRKTNFRNLTSLKKLPRIEGSDHEGSLYHPAAKIDIGIQVDFASDLQAPEAQDNSEISAISAVSELDRHVQVEAQPVPSDACPWTPLVGRSIASVGYFTFFADFFKICVEHCISSLYY